MDFTRNTTILAQFLTRTATSKEIIRAKPNLYWGCALWRRLHHNRLGAVAGLSENMAGLRFSYVHKFGFNLLKD